MCSIELQATYGDVRDLMRLVCLNPPEEMVLSVLELHGNVPDFCPPGSSSRLKGLELNCGICPGGLKATTFPES